MSRVFVLLFAGLMVTGTDVFSADPDVFEDDFSAEVEGRWERVAGDWRIENGKMTHHTPGHPGHGQLVADFPFREGMIEVTGVAIKENDYKFASLGLVIKHVDGRKRIWFRFGSYGAKNIDGSAPGFTKVPLGVGKPQLGKEYRLSVIVRNGLIAVSIDDVIIGIARDPLAGETGRPGLFSESDVEYNDFRVTRYAK